MKYRSTRDQGGRSLTSPQAIIKGLSPDGGLFVPVDFPHADWTLAELSRLSYQELAQRVLHIFFDDFTSAQLAAVVQGAYGQQWDQPAIAPLSARHAGNYYLELFHGPTLAFKDVALQVLPRLMTQAVRLVADDNQIVILTATSGDTGTAAMCGFSDLAGTRVIVFYPHGGVSPVQLTQMLAQPGENLAAIAIKGNFDDAQTTVKQIFNDTSFGQRLLQNGFQFSSANSMNIGRLIPQIVYYLNSYGQLVHRGAIKEGDPVNFAVPTGNFGDILAGFYAKRLGLPIHHLICASNENNVLTDFFNTGTYNRQRRFHLTNAPAMDILVSSNLERLLFHLTDGDASQVKDWMTQLQDNGHYSVDGQTRQRLQQVFSAGFATPQQVESEIRRVYQQADYLIDPHTAVASAVVDRYQRESGDDTPTIIVATASPFKFPETVCHAVSGQAVKQRGLPAIKELQQFLGGKELPLGVRQLFCEQPRPEQVVAPDQMAKVVATRLGLDQGSAGNAVKR